MRYIKLLGVAMLLVTAMWSSEAIEAGGRGKSYEIKLNDIRATDGAGSAGSFYWGAANAKLLRVLDAAYPGDGSGNDIIESPDRMNPRSVSNIVSKQTTSVENDGNLSDYLWAWGQLLDHDIDLTDASSTNGHADIEIEDPADPLGPNDILFDRSNFALGTGTASVPRQQINEITAFIDASNVYGSDSLRAGTLREFAGGRLKTGDADLLPFNTTGLPNAGGTDATLFVAGDVRSNENVVLSSLHTLFLREHNRLANLITLHNPTASDEEIFQLARKIVGAEMQLITYNEFLPALLGRYAPRLRSLRYNRRVDPGIRSSFSTAFYRFGHTTLSSNLQLVQADGTPAGVLPLQDAFFRPSFLVDDPQNVDRLLGGLATQPCQNIDTLVVDDVRDFLFGPPGAGGLDLVSLNIQRGRDHGLADYNSFRRAYRLPKVRRFNQITKDTELAAALEEAYGTVDNIDPWVGALAEDHIRRANCGTLLTRALQEQFTRLISGDHFSINNDRDLQQDLVKAIIPLNDLKLVDVIRANTSVRSLPSDPFYVNEEVDMDVTLKYDRREHRLYVTGGRGDNSISIVEVAAGLFSFTCHNGSSVNGSTYGLIGVRSRPSITIDLGAGNDYLGVFGAQFTDASVSLGSGDDEFSTLGSSALKVFFDAGAGNNDVDPSQSIRIR